MYCLNVICLWNQLTIIIILASIHGICELKALLHWTHTGHHSVYISNIIFSLQKYELHKFAPSNKHLSEEERDMLHGVLSKYLFLFDVKIGTWKTKPVDT